ncbi:MAG: hypothetical protein K8W52_35715 [Deltaproteobacteria bacterium]|nr:hypothetical protein [Deltaproteobacteria bacterium]
MTRHSFLSFGLSAGLSVGLAASFVGTLTWADAAHAQPAAKATKACGVTAIPLQVGNEWTYAAVAMPGRAVDPSDAKKYPKQPAKVVITVAGIETQNGVTTVTLSEDADGHKISTTIACSATKFDISPDSFFFAGEPGGSFNVAFTSFEHKGGTTLKLAGGRLQGPDWRDDIVAKWKQTPSTGTDRAPWIGSLEMERHYVLAGTDNIASTGGVFNGAQKLTLEITGRVILDPPDANPAELPAGLKNTFWFADTIGIVQVSNSYNHVYQLANTKLAK